MRFTRNILQLSPALWESQLVRIKLFSAVGIEKSTLEKVISGNKTQNNFFLAAKAAQ